MTGDAIDSAGTVSQRSWVLTAVSFGLVMTGFSGNMISVALPFIGSDLHISDRQLAQAVSAYVATSGAALLVAGRFGDAFGYQRMFALGVCLCDAAPDRVGAASGLISTSYTLGGALGLSVLGSIAARHTADLIAAGVDETTAQSCGYRTALGLSAAVAFAAAVIGAAVLRNGAEVEKNPRA